MAGQYSHKQFFRYVPNAQLANYFEAKKINLVVDFKDYNGKEVDTIFQVFTALAEDQQADIKAEFQNLDAMACDGGIVALVDWEVAQTLSNTNLVLSKRPFLEQDGHVTPSLRGRRTNHEYNNYRVLIWRKMSFNCTVSMCAVNQR